MYSFKSVQLPNSAWSVQNSAAQGQRELIARFWISAPTDMLESLWVSPLGKATSELVESLQDDSQLNFQEIELRNQINQRLANGLQQPLSPQFLLAVFLFSPKGRLTIQNPEQSLPSWLVSIYQKLYGNIQVDPVLSVPTNTPATVNPNLEDLNQFPDTLQELVSNQIQLNRMLGLANLYYIDPEDKEIYDELIEIRRSFAYAIDRCKEEELEQIWTNHLQDRYWAIVRSGLQTQPLSQIDEEIKQSAVQKLSPSQGGGFDKPGAINALLISMLYFEPGSMTVNEPEKNIPLWLKSNFQEIFMQPLSSN